MYVLIVGAGQIGRQVIDLATASGNEVVVIESDQAAASAIDREYDCLVLNADATELSVLEDAGADVADAIICTTESDATNLMVLFLARELDIPSLVTVVQDPDHMHLFRQIGANVLENPQRLIAEYLFRAVQRPSIRDFMSLSGEAEIFEISVDEQAPIVGRALEDADADWAFGEDALIVAIERDSEVLIPKGGTVLQAGDLVTVVSLRGMTESVLAPLTTPDKRDDPWVL